MALVGIGGAPDGSRIEAGRRVRDIHRGRMRRFATIVLLLPLALPLLLACAACAHGNSIEQGVFSKGELRIGLGPVPGSWRRIGVEGADLAFRDDEREGSALFDVRCDAPGQDAPLAILTQDLIIGTTERDVESQKVLPFDGREAMHTVLRAKLDGVPMQYDIYVMKKDGCLYDLVYVAPPSHFPSGSGDFERFAAGVHTLSRSTAAEGVRSQPSRDP